MILEQRYLTEEEIALRLTEMWTEQHTLLNYNSIYEAYKNILEKLKEEK